MQTRLIRAAGADDIPALLAIARTLPDWFTHTALLHLATDLQFQRVYLAEAEAAGGDRGPRRAAGFVTGYTYDGLGHIGWLAVERSHHRQGVGRALVLHMEAALAAAGVREVEVFTVSDRLGHEPYVRTRAFYRALGYVTHRYEALESPEWPEALYLRKALAAAAGTPVAGR